jgi:hypothetical protein
MKQVGKWIMAATLFCGLFTLTSCVDDRDNPVDNGVSDDVIRNREEILSHVKSDAKILADNMNPEMFNLTSEVYSQLMALMTRDRNYMKNMKQILVMMAANNALKNIKPVTKGSELAKMGYQMYIPVDIQTFGVQVVFDENGNSRLFPCEGLEFIFPATVEGLGTTLYKVAFRAGSNWKETVAPAQLKNLKGIACVYRVPETITMTLSGQFDNEVLTLSNSIFDIGETQISGQSSTSLKGVGYGLPDVESTLDFNFNIVQKGTVKIDCSYVNNGLNIMTLGAMMTLPEIGKITELLSNIEFKGISVDFDMQILDDLNLYGSILDAAQFSQAFMDMFKNNQNSQVSEQKFSDIIDKLSSCTKSFLSCQQAMNPLDFKLMSGEGSYANKIMPAIWSYEQMDFVPFSELMEKTDMDNVNKVINSVIPPMGTNTFLNMQVLLRIMQMLPLNSAEWGL